MTCERTHRARISGLSAKTLWKVWSDVNNWHTWDSDIEWAHIEGEFTDGNTFELKAKDGPKVKITLSQVVPESAFTDCASFPLAKMYSIHKLVVVNGELELSHTINVTGPLKKLWWHLVAKKLASGLEEQTEKLVARARQFQ